ncbi:uncharacterized protein LOC105695869, partial [Orussus abietinus]|uniref:uncharacterized protein LOC105695869 n=1 Tax=Orussus abietinus TaxID=222816 RepID=UPI000C715DE5
VLQRDIEAHGRIVSSVVKLSERISGQQKEEEPPSQAVRVARSLERRWHLLFLRGLEWQCHIETLASRKSSKSLGSSRYSSDSEEEPVTKQPRLSRRKSREHGRSSSDQSGHSMRTTRPKRPRASRRQDYDSASSRDDHFDSDVSNDNRFSDDGLYFEDELSQFSVMDTSAPEDSRKTEKVSGGCSTEGRGQEETGDVVDGATNDEKRREMPPLPVIVPIATSTLLDCVHDEINSGRPIEISISNGFSAKGDQNPKRRRIDKDAASFNMSDRKSKNCATFYFKHLDTDSEADCCLVTEEFRNGADDSSEEEWSYRTARSTDKMAAREEVKTAEDVANDGDSKAERSARIRFASIQAGEGEDGSKGEVLPKESTRRVYEEENEQERCEVESEDESKNDKMSIQKLIREVEKLVREEGTAGMSRTFPPLVFEEKGLASNNRAKYIRIKEWLKLNATRPHEGRSVTENWRQTMDSCDASGEYTTGESDVDKQSVSSEDLHSSVVTYRRLDGTLGCTSQSISQEVIDDADKTPIEDGHQPLLETSTPKVMMRSNRKWNGPRPWSVSCISQLANHSNLAETNDPISQFSISESALHQLVATLPTKSVSLDATGSCLPFDNSSSTLLEEAAVGRDGSILKSSSVRRKKSKSRKKNLNRKSESSSEGANANPHSAGSDGCSNHQRSSRKNNTSRAAHANPMECHSHLTTLVKSGSFSGCTARQQLFMEKSTVGGSAPFSRSSRCKWDASTSEEERVDSADYPAYQNNPLLEGQSNADSDVEKNSLGNNSFSEQAWDNYQEKYMSEPYSEVPDLEAASKLLDFGDDYRNFLDSQSDCASSMSAVHGNSPPMPRRRIHHILTESTEDSDSDSDADYICNLLEKSHSQLLMSENIILRANGAPPSGNWIEVESACKENIRCLNAVLAATDHAFPLGKNVKQIHELIKKWETLSTRTEEVRLANDLHRDMAKMCLELRAVHDRLVSYEIVLEQQHLLDERIHQVTNELTTLRDRKTAMLALNVSAHRLIVDSTVSESATVSTLKDDVADLYRIWDEVFQKGNQQLMTLQAVQQFSVKFNELQCALQRDKDTLSVLNVALQSGVTSDVASSVREVARLLSEKQDASCKNGTGPGSVATEGTNMVVLANTGALIVTGTLAHEGGSLSDSGISDSGSEQELSERERRLAALRGLIRVLEAQLTPGSVALVDLSKRVEDVEAELRNLQKQCRHLIVQTAVTAEARSKGQSLGQLEADLTQNIKKESNRPKRNASKSEHPIRGRPPGGLADDDPEDDPGEPTSWIWRVLRSALPFQLALVALFCAAYLLEPHCCEASNTLNLYLTPQLRYVRGPPPV